MEERDIPTWDLYFLKFAELASTRSKDLNTNIGAVIVGPDNEVISTGYNSFPRGLKDNLPERHERPEKYFWMEHGERNAIFSAARRQGAALHGCRMYLNCFVPCTDCARAIIQVGIKEIILGVTHQSTQIKWLKSAKRSLMMFREAGVMLRYPDSKSYIQIDNMLADIDRMIDENAVANLG